MLTKYMSTWYRRQHGVYIYMKEYWLWIYLSDIKNVAIKRRVSKLRLSNHALMIETGRHYNIPKELRLCSLCLTSVGTEVNFLFSMSNLQHEGYTLWNYFGKHWFVLIKTLYYVLYWWKHNDTFHRGAFLLTLPKGNMWVSRCSNTA